MKQTISLALLMLSLLSIEAFAQAPQSFNYQAVARDINGNIIANKTVSLRFNILDGSSNGTLVYQETQNPTTNILGLCNVIIGKGTVTSGIFSSIAWGNGAKFLKVEIDPAGGNNFTFLGTAQLLSVPYALYAANSGGGVGGGWLLTGNQGTIDGTNFMGTLDSVPINFRMNNHKAGRIEMEQMGGNTSFGFQSLNSNVSGSSNVAIGNNSLFHSNIGNNLVAVGDSALFYDGYTALNNIQGSDNTAIGSKALLHNTQGLWNTATGSNASYSNTQGQYNTSDGWVALYSNTVGHYNTAIGAQALYSNQNGLDNTALGVQALYSNTTGFNNTALGEGALYYNINGLGNTAVGRGALAESSTGIYNTATGNEALISNTTGNFNTANGFGALYFNTTGRSNVAVGIDALYNSAHCNNLVAVGDSALWNQLGGFGYNTAIGSKALFTNINGSANTAIGFNADVSKVGLTNSTAIGYEAKVGASNSLVLGGTGGNAVNVGIGTTTPNSRLEITSGDVYMDTIATGVILTSPNGQCWRVTVDNSGNLISTSITCP